MHTHGNIGSAIGSGTAGMLEKMAGCAEVRSTPLGRLENALNRLSNVADATCNSAMALTGGWPVEARQQAKDAAPSAGVFGAVEEIASAIHRVCDRLDEANRAVVERLP